MKNIVIGNWKMNESVGEAVSLAKRLKRYKQEKVEIVVCPPFIDMVSVVQALDSSSIIVGAQNVFYEKKGAYTGEISASMLKSAGCKYVIVGHSERRRYFNETDIMINNKLKSVLSAKLKAVLCVGEKQSERKKGVAKKVIKSQVERGLKGVDSISRVVLAYEPVWAIGTGKTAIPEQAEEIHSIIRGILVNRYGKAGEKARILYGGSVNKRNAASLAAMPNINGALVGGASLNYSSFTEIIRHF